ncbi:MAG TPA: hypothetical protein VGJ87_05020 [Roseiflexaceae bacterium]|jgi:hypothetical protein
MQTTDQRLAARLTQEISDLALEIFTSVYGADWGYATRQAVATLPELIAFADDWDFDAECQAIAAREVL